MVGGAGGGAMECGGGSAVGTGGGACPCPNPRCAPHPLALLLAVFLFLSVEPLLNDLKVPKVPSRGDLKLSPPPLFAVMAKMASSNAAPGNRSPSLPSPATAEAAAQPSGTSFVSSSPHRVSSAAGAVVAVTAANGGNDEQDDEVEEEEEVAPLSRIACCLRSAAFSNLSLRLSVSFASLWSTSPAFRLSYTWRMSTDSR